MIAPEPSPLHPSAAPSPPRCPLRCLALTGFMGAGKTTVGKLLAAQHHWPFIDVDAQIEASTGTSIAQLFAQCGEAAFRALEHRTIRDLVLAPEARTLPPHSATPPAILVLALGGGAIEDPHTRQLLLATEGIALVHLEVTLAEAVRRCEADDNHLRPVLADRTRLAARYQRRLALYRQAHLTLAVDTLAPHQIAAQIEAQIAVWLANTLR